jgi:hypothetical protein
MSEGLKIALTAVTGITVFVLGQIIQKWFIEPIQEQRKLVGDIVYSIVFYSNLFTYTEAFLIASKIRHQAKGIEGRDAELLDEAYELLKEKSDGGSKKLRELSSQIHQSLQVIPCYWVLEKLRIVYKRKTLYDISSKLILWNQNPELETTVACQNAIIYLLNIKHLIQRREEGQPR